MCKWFMFMSGVVILSELHHTDNFISLPCMSFSNSAFLLYNSLSNDLRM